MEQRKGQQEVEGAKEGMHDGDWGGQGLAGVGERGLSRVWQGGGQYEDEGPWGKGARKRVTR